MSAAVRAKAGIAAGDNVDVDVVADTEPRSVEVPEDLRTAPAREPAARRGFQQLCYTAQHRHVLAIEQAKTPQTRQRRIDKALTELSAAPAKTSR